jgi:prepilin-type N-terminal cleavage/methylation domain-containing protein
MRKQFVKKLFGKREAFTLVEILVVVAVIGILFVAFVPRIDFAGEKARETGVKSDFRAFMLASEQVLRENAGLAFVTGTAVDTATTNANTTLVAEKLNLYLDPALQLTAVSGKNQANTLKPDAWNQKYVMSTSAKKGDNNAKILFECGGKDSLVNGTNDYFVLISYKDGAIKSATSGFSSNIGSITSVPASGTAANTKLSGTGAMEVD